MHPVKRCYIFSHRQIDSNYSFVCTSFYIEISAFQYAILMKYKKYFTLILAKRPRSDCIRHTLNDNFLNISVFD